jgi:hypothetical protein
LENSKTVRTLKEALVKFFTSGIFVLLTLISAASFADSSENRANKGYSALVQPIGYGPSNSFSAGLIGGYHLDGQSILLLEYMTNIYNKSYGDVSGNHHRAWTGRSIGVHYKHFLANSFYLKGGFDSRDVNYSDESSGGTSGFEGNSLAFSVAIGNQWHFSYFTFGCDWIGYVMPISSSIRSEYNIGPSPASRESDLNDQKSIMVTSHTTQFLRFYLGASF